MVNRIGTIYPCGLNKGFSSRYWVGFRVWHEMPEEGQRMYQPKHCEYNNKDEVNSLNILSDKKKYHCCSSKRMALALNSSWALFKKNCWSRFFYDFTETCKSFKRTSLGYNSFFTTLPSCNEAYIIKVKEFLTKQSDISKQHKECLTTRVTYLKWWIHAFPKVISMKWNAKISFRNKQKVGFFFRVIC